MERIDIENRLEEVEPRIKELEAAKEKRELNSIFPDLFTSFELAELTAERNRLTKRRTHIEAEEKESEKKRGQEQRARRQAEAIERARAEVSQVKTQWRIHYYDVWAISRDHGRFDLTVTFWHIGRPTIKELNDILTKSIVDKPMDFAWAVNELGPPGPLAPLYKENAGADPRSDIPGWGLMDRSGVVLQPLEHGQAYPVLEALEEVVPPEEIAEDDLRIHKERTDVMKDGRKVNRTRPPVDYLRSASQLGLPWAWP